jgi:hypothetical protein
MRYSTRRKANTTESSKGTGRSEHVEQREFVSWFRKNYKGIRIIAIPNGGQRNIATAARLKAEGVMRGVPDLYVPAWMLWIEMKKINGGRISPEQKDWHNYLQSINQNVIVTAGFEDAKLQIEDFTEEKDDGG